MKCEKCKINGRIKGERYCKECKKIILNEMKKSGYLTSKAKGSYQ
jgi:hypothetical protein